MNKQEDNNWKVVNVRYNDQDLRMYNELTCNADITLYLETMYKWHELIEKYKFKIYYLKTLPITDLKIFLKDKKKINGFNESVKKIKFLQGNDLYYLYMNILFEVLYFFPHIDYNNNYSYSFIFIVDQNFDINKILNHNFNLVKIISVEELTKNKINFELVKTIFESRTFIDNSTARDGDFTYDFNYFDLNWKEFVNEYYNGDESKANWDHYFNLDTIKSSKIFNQNLYSMYYFRFLCTHIWSFDRVHYIEENEYGQRYSHIELYGINKSFLTNFGELMGIKSVVSKKKELNEQQSFFLKEELEGESFEIEDMGPYPCCLRDNFVDQGICEQDISKEFVLNGFIDFTNKEIKKVKLNE